MYAIVDIAGQQFKVEKDKKVYVHRLKNEEGQNVEFDKVLLLDNNGQINIGNPIIKGASITAKVLEHVKGDKVLVFKKKRRKGYQKLNGHRQSFTQILIEDIILDGNKLVAEGETAKPKKTAVKKTVVKAEKEEKAVTKKPAAKKTTKKAE